MLFFKTDSQKANKSENVSFNLIQKTKKNEASLNFNEMNTQAALCWPCKSVNFSP